MTTTDPDADDGIEKVVPDTVMTPPGVKVCPGPSTNTLVPPRTVAVMEDWPLTVRTGRPWVLRVDVTPLTMTLAPEPSLGKL
jgi:hypothetical protein